MCVRLGPRREGSFRRKRPPRLPTLLLLVLGPVLAGCERCSPEAREVQVPDPAAVNVGSAEGRYLGSKACGPCHAVEYRSWRASHHRSTLRPFSSAAPPRLASASLPEGYAVEVSGEVKGPGAEGGVVLGQAAYVVGGRRREELWVRLEDGRLQVFPIAYDLDGNKPLELLGALPGGSPPKGDSVDFWTRLARNADLGCYGCHATGAIVRIAGATQAGNAVPRSEWAEAGVGCEACHGPGSPHVEAAKAGRPRDARTATAATTESDQKVGVCASCHGLRDLLSSPLSNTPAHPYGQPVWNGADPVLNSPANAEFRDPLFPDLRPATYQQEAVALAQSPCAVKGGLDCARCHDPHSGEIRTEARGDAACFPCHDGIGAQGSAHTRHPAGKPGSGCPDCHMAAILRGPGSALARDHALSTPAADGENVPMACAGCHLGRVDAARVVEGWKAFPRGSREAKRRLGIAKAITAWQRGEGSPAGALAAIVADPGEGWASRVLAAALLEKGPVGEASPDVAQALRAALRDPNPALKRAAARTLGRWGSAADRAELLPLVASEDPFLALAAVEALGRLGDPEYGARLTALVRRPDLLGEYRAQLAIGAAFLHARDWPRAEQSLARSLELHPLQVPALNDLGIALFSQGRADRARALWRQALEINPRFEGARLNLEAVGNGDSNRNSRPGAARMQPPAP